MANSFGDLIYKLKNSVTKSHIPGLFRKEFFEIAPQYAGFVQHDAQEALAYILDILHEDLNRVLEKPAVLNTDMSNDILDSVGAIEYMTNYSKRNISAISDLFAGQEKSTILCPKCDRTLKQFPIFFSLSLPIPIEQRIKCEIYPDLNFFHSKPLSIDLKISHEISTILHLKNELLKQFTL